MKVLHFITHHDVALVTAGLFTVSLSNIEIFLKITLLLSGIIYNVVKIYKEKKK